MGTITAEKTTIFKVRNTDAAQMLPRELVTVKEGTKLDIAKVIDDKNQHAKIVLQTPVTANDGNTSITEGFVYEPHFNIPFEVMPREIKINVKYRTQLDNYDGDHGTPYRQCALTSRTIALDNALKRFDKGDIDAIAKVNGFREGEGYYGRVLKKYGDTTVHAAHVKAFKEFGLESYFSSTASLSDLIEALTCQMCVPIAVSYKSSGHIICVVGYNPDKKFFWVHDPYGVRAGAADYYAVRGGNAGAYDRYSLEVMRQIFGDVGNKESGWAHFITAVDGQPTGIPNGL